MKLTKIKLKEMIIEEIQRLNEEKYMKEKNLKPGMTVMHEDWDRRTGEPMDVVKVKGKIMLRLSGYPDTYPGDGGESDYGWYQV